jgi:AcrR family transcriptional regulator
MVKRAPPPHGRQPRVRRDEVRRRLLAAAYGVFAERGYEGTSLDRVAEAAGFSKGAVYSNFANKDELFFELIAARVDERAVTVRAADVRRKSRSPAGRGLSSAVASARLAGRMLRDLGEADPSWQMLFIEFWLRCVRRGDLREKLAERRRAMRTRIAQYIEAQTAASGSAIGRKDALDLATTVLALSNGLGIEGLIDPQAVRRALFGEILAKIVSGG